LVKGTLILFIFLGLALVSSAQSSSDRKITLKTKTPDKAVVYIKNNGANFVEFSYRFNNKFYRTLKDYVEEIRSEASINQKKKPERLAWEKVAEDIYHQQPYSEAKWANSPLLLLNSFGFGFCDDAACALASTWNELGYKSRVIDLQKHVVPEVMVNKTWKMYDPDTYVFYVDSAGHVLPVDSILSNPTEKTKKFVSQGFSRLIKKPNDSSKYYKNVNKKVLNSTLYLFEQKSDLFTITLPPKAVFSFPEYCSDIKKDYKYAAFAKLTLPQEFSGEINNSLALCDISGSGRFFLNQNTYELPRDRDIVKTLLKQTTLFVQKLYISQITDSLSLIYFINPAFAKVSKNNILEISGTYISNLGYYLKIIEKNSKCKPFSFDDYNYLAPSIEKTAEIIGRLPDNEISSIDKWEEVGIYLNLSECNDYENKAIAKEINNHIEYLEKELPISQNDESFWDELNNPVRLAILYELMVNAQEGDFEEFVDFLRIKRAEL
jgi:hypothetical protein